jgi:acyl-CoA thioesterase-1
MARAVVEGPQVRVVTLGDSILDCGSYSAHGLTPGQLLVRNDDALFPEFRGQDLASCGPAHLEHRAVDGATVSGLAAQARGLRAEEPSLARVTGCGNDLLNALMAGIAPDVDRLMVELGRFLRWLPIRPVLLGYNYAPSFGDDSSHLLGIDPALARPSLRRLNAGLAELGGRYGALVDLHAHFLTGDPSWFVYDIEPSLIGASEVRRCFLRLMSALRG